MTEAGWGGACDECGEVFDEGSVVAEIVEYGLPEDEFQSRCPTGRQFRGCARHPPEVPDIDWLTTDTRRVIADELSKGLTSDRLMDLIRRDPNAAGRKGLG